jgi:serine/threonine protein phosphatase PrpC
MPENAWNLLWKTVPSSRKGPDHINQDSIAYFQESTGSGPIILAVSDGHGSAKHFRSSSGAQFATMAAVDAMRESLGAVLGGVDPSRFSEIKRWTEAHLPRLIQQRWDEKVDADLSLHPLLEGELAAVEKRGGRKAVDSLRKDNRVAYGATIIAVCIARDFIIFLQLGDGEILTVSGRNGVSRPLPEDAEQIANETRSLCQPGAWTEFRVGFEPMNPSPPDLILLCTDGFANAFPTEPGEEEGFLRTGSRIYDLMATKGVPYLKENLEGWLTEASKYTGDDVSLGLVIRESVPGAEVIPETGSSDPPSGDNTPSGSTGQGPGD